MNFSSYFVLSTLVVAGIVAHAYVAHEQFYPAVVYLSTDKMCLAVMYNFAFALFLLFGKVLLRIFIGTLRDLEVEQLVDSGRGFLADTILFLVFYAPTIDNREVGTVYLIQYICCVIFMKVFHLTTQIRVSHMFEVGVPRLIVNVKLVALMCLLLGCDLMALQYFYSVASRSSTFFTWILFEALTMSTVVLVSICKYSVHMVDLRLDNGWPGKSVCLFYIDLVHDVVSMTLFLVFMLTFFVQNPSRLPIYMMADVIQVARKLAQRLRSFRRYRRISLNMEARFPDATDEEIENNEHCVICRDSLFDGSKPKKLHCGHIFHIDCLRSWLVMQQVCPTCRAEIPADGPTLPMVPPARAPAMAQAAPLEGAASPPAAVTPPPEAAAVEAANAAGNSAMAAVASPGGSTPSLATPASAQAPVAAPAAMAAPAFPATPAAPGAAAPDGATPLPQPAAAVAQTAPVAMPAPVQASAQAAISPVCASAVGQMIGAYGALGSLPPVPDIMDSLKRAEDISKFLRQQTDFWMEQVRQIERMHVQSGDTSASASCFPMAAQLPMSAGGSAVAGTDSVLGLAKAAGLDTSSTANSCDKVAEDVPQESKNEAAESSPAGGNQLAELRRAQKEQWERKRTSELLGDAGSSP